MFTGIITHIGTVVALQQDEQSDTAVLVLDTAGAAAGLPEGGSLAVNGACLTSVPQDADPSAPDSAPDDGLFRADLMGQTLRMTALGELSPGDRVNLERCLRPTDHLDGHIVQGHVDGVGTVVQVADEGAWRRVRVAVPDELARVIPAQGAITVQGVSLTVTAVSAPSQRRHWFEVGLIPATLEATVLGALAPGDRVNLETDVMARYAERMKQIPSSEPVRLDGVDRAVEQLAAGRPVIVVDDEDRENEGDIVFAAALATDEVTAFTIRHTSGVLCAPMPGAVADRLELPPMTATNQDPKGTAYTVSVDAAVGVTTGISAADRARTLRVLAGAQSAPADLTRPGHVFPLRAVDGGVAQRSGHTEAGVELCRLAGLAPVAAIAELTHDDGTMMRLPALRRFADDHALALISIEDLQAHLSGVDSTEDALLPTKHGQLRVSAHRDAATGVEHVLLRPVEPVGDSGAPDVVRVHSECLTGDAFGSLRCDCGPQLQHALEQTARTGGAVLYVRGHEGRGIGLAAKLRAYALQDAGRDTVDANLDLGLPADARDWAGAAAVLRAAGLERIRLVTNNPAKADGLREHGIDIVELLPAPAPVTEHNLAYLRTKRDRMGHTVPGLD